MIAMKRKLLESAVVVSLAFTIFVVPAAYLLSYRSRARKAAAGA